MEKKLARSSTNELNRITWNESIAKTVWISLKRAKFEENEEESDKGAHLIITSDILMLFSAGIDHFQCAFFDPHMKYKRHESVP